MTSKKPQPQPQQETEPTFKLIEPTQDGCQYQFSNGTVVRFKPPTAMTVLRVQDWRMTNEGNLETGVFLAYQLADTSLSYNGFANLIVTKDDLVAVMEASAFFRRALESFI